MATTRCTPARGITNNSPHTARIKFKASQPDRPFISAGAAWGATIFHKGAFVVSGLPNAPIDIRSSGGGGGFAPAWNPVKVCGALATLKATGDCDAIFQSAFSDALRYFHLRKMEFANSGKVTFYNVNTELIGPVKYDDSVTAIELKSNLANSFFNLNGNTMTSRTLRVENVVLKDTASKKGKLVFAPEEEDEVGLSGPIDATVPVEMSGEGTLDISGAEVKGQLTVVSGTVSITNEAYCSKFRLEGGELVVDGGMLKVDSWTNLAGTVTCVNGGRVVLPVDATEANNWMSKPNGPEGALILKTGSKDTIVYDPPVALGGVDVRAGKLSFSAYGRPEKYIRIIYSKMSTVKTKDTVKPLTMGKVALFGADGSIASDSAGNRDDGTAASALGNGPAYAYTTTVTKDSSFAYWSTEKHSVFSVITAATWGGLAMNNICVLSAPNIDPEDPSTHYGYVVKIPAARAYVSGYDFSIQGSKDHPTDWTIEGSPDGKDDTWTVWDTRTDQHPKNAGVNEWWLGGGRGEQTQAFELPGTYMALQA